MNFVFQIVQSGWMAMLFTKVENTGGLAGL